MVLVLFFWAQKSYSSWFLIGAICVRRWGSQWITCFSIVIMLASFAYLEFIGLCLQKSLRCCFVGKGALLGRFVSYVEFGSLVPWVAAFEREEPSGF